jgi:hypothetical protein
MATLSSKKSTSMAVPSRVHSRSCASSGASLRLSECGLPGRPFVQFRDDSVKELAARSG